MTNKEIKERLTDSITLLKIPGVGRARFHKLVRTFGSPKTALAASGTELEAISGISHNLAREIKDKADPAAAREIASRIIQLGWTVLFPDSDQFPESLRNIYDIPPLLFRLGEDDSDQSLIAIVGTRHPTDRGKMLAHNLARALAESGVTVVSGMAEGIDSAAHRGCLEAGGKTIAVWGCALDIVYPRSNKGLAEQIKQNGAIFSEYLPGTGPDRAFFPERNRIISGLSSGVVVIEAGHKSGALITASHAVDQGREVFAVPGSPDAKNSAGANELIKKGAKLLTSVEDIFEELPTLKGEVLARKFIKLPDMTDTESRIVELFASGPLQIDQIARQADMPVGELMEFLLALELKGIVQELSGKRFVLSEEYSW